MMFTEPQVQRYARHIVMPEIGVAGQARLMAARVLVVGAGGLGAPAILYLAAAGIGTLGIVDDDRVELSNLQRQILHGTPDLGVDKVASAVQAVRRLNPEIAVEPHCLRLDRDNAAALFARYDLVVDGTDGVDSRYAIADAARAAGKTLISGAVLQFDGQLATFKPHQGPPHPCYHCLHPVPPPPDAVPSCAAAGVLGAVAGVIGSLQAVEVVREILDLPGGLSGRLLLYQALDLAFRVIRLPRRADCPQCGPLDRATTGG